MIEDKHYRLAAAWEPKDAVVLCWPDQLTMLLHDGIVELYEALVTVLIDYVDVAVVAQRDQFDEIRNRLEVMDVPIEHVYFYDVKTYTLTSASENLLIIENENNQFALLNRHQSLVESLRNQGAFPHVQIDNCDIQLSVNDLESDGDEHLLVNVSRLHKKNSHMDVMDLQNCVKKYFPHENITYIQTTMGSLPARIIPDGRCLYLSCDETDSQFYAPLKNIENQLIQQFEKMDEPIELIPLPWGGAIQDDKGEEKLADYSQFIVINEVVLVPLFDLPSDEDAMEVLFQAFPGFDIMGFPCTLLAEMDIRLSEITATIPEGVFELT